jgi:hypothetical protein
MPSSNREPSAIERPATWDSWSEDERALWWRVQDELKESDAAGEALWAALPDHSPEMFSLVDRLHTSAADPWFARGLLLAARLKRYRPDLADLIDFASGSNLMFPAGSPHEDPYETTARSSCRALPDTEGRYFCR